MISDDEWRTQWAAMLEQAKQRVSMYIGRPAVAHLDYLLSPIELAWKAGVFSSPQSASIDLSPNQYIVRIVSGPLIREIQDIFQWGGGRTLNETWRADSAAYFGQIDTEDRNLPLGERRSRRSSWRYCLSGPTGPRLDDPSVPRVFASRLYWALRTGEGLWCEGYDHGWPLTAPQLCSGHNEFGMVAAAHLTPEYFLGLPFREDDVHRNLNPPVHRFGDGITAWDPPKDVTVRWHAKDDLLIGGDSAASVIGSLLDG